MTMRSELHEYISKVLDTGDHGPIRHIPFDKTALNDAIEKYRPQIASLIKGDVHHPEEGHVATVQNYLGNVSFRCTVTAPNDLSDLMNIMAAAKREGKKVRAVGGFHAWSPVCETSGYLVTTDKLTGTTPTTKSTLKNPSQEGLYEVLGGTKLKDAIDVLEKDGRALMNLGGFTGQSIVGATATGTHGSGLSIPPLASMICGLTLVSAQFDASDQPILYRIEPTDGITDRKLHNSPAILIQDDATFNAVVTGLCSFGIIYSVTITTVPFYWVFEERELVDWLTVKQSLEKGPEGDILKYHNAEIWVNPYTSKALISRRTTVTVKPPHELSNRNTSAFVTFVDAVPVLRKLAGDIYGLSEDLLEGTYREIGATVAVVLNLFPLLVPSSLDIALETQNHSEPKTAKYYDIYHIGFVSWFPAISSEISFPMANYLSAMESTMSLLRKLQKDDVYKAITGFLSLRFTASTPASISMSYSSDPQSPGRNYLEIFSLWKFYPSPQGFWDVLHPVADQSVNEYQGRLHWGQYIPPDFTSLRYKQHDSEFYDSIVRFKKIVEKFDPGRMMVNDFLNRVIWLAVD